MPVIDGVTAMKHIKQKFSEQDRPTVIALTALAIKQCLPLGISCQHGRSRMAI